MSKRIAVTCYPPGINPNNPDSATNAATIEVAAKKRELVVDEKGRTATQFFNYLMRARGIWGGADDDKRKKQLADQLVKMFPQPQETEKETCAVFAEQWIELCNAHDAAQETIAAAMRG